MNKAKELSKLKKKAFKLWSEKVRSIGCCELCGIKKGELNPKGNPTILDAHHLIERNNHRLAWDLKNGISLCKFHHKFSNVGPHKGSLIFINWFKNKYPDKFEYLLNSYEEKTLLNIEHLQKIVQNLS